MGPPDWRVRKRPQISISGKDISLRNLRAKAIFGGLTMSHDSMKSHSENLP
jgi:hypothetical protein